ncbi:MAG: hypothetical protein HYR94_22430 [Chloroflexi bacterium]|nr:hypothetical protein [Chloroflexota bacterium]
MKHLIDLNSVQFIQEGIAPPGIFVKFEFGEQPIVDTVKVKQDGDTEGFHKSVATNQSFLTLIEAITLAYYRDLVTPGKIYYYQPGRRDPRPGPYRPPNPKPPNPRELPRPQNIPLHVKNNPRLKDRAFHQLHTWHEARERARHLVVGHIRWSGEGFIANPEKQQQASQHLGKKLPPGYTFVIEHDRGGLGSGGLRLSSDGYLMERTLFLPPERASADLDKLLA